MSSSSRAARTPIKNQRIQDEREGKEERQEAKRPKQQEQAQQKRAASFEAARSSSLQPELNDGDSSNNGGSDAEQSKDDSEEEESKASSSSSSSIPVGVNRSQLALYTHLPSPVTIPPTSIHLTYLHSFLSAAECSTLLSLTTHFTASTIGSSSADTSVDPSRTSFSSALSGRSSSERIAKLLGCEDKQIEALNVVRYEPGQQYKPHYDSSLSDDFKSRQFTVFSYLNDVTGGGGETDFLKIGIKFKPKCGDALLWENHASEAEWEHDDGQHAGLPPVSDTKYGQCSCSSSSQLRCTRAASRCALADCT
jgi:hypothetical protein